jgi:hypothetical protein
VIAQPRGTPLPAFFLACAFSIIWPSQVLAKTIQIDDTGTQALEPSVSLRWQSVTPSRSGTDNLMLGRSTIRVRLNVMPWLHRSLRIYLNLPAQQPGPIAISWLSQGRFIPGQLRSGNRVLLYAGQITTPFLEDTLNVQYSVDGSLVRRPFPVTFHFETDED